MRHSRDLLDAGGLTFAIAFPTAAAWLYFVTYADAPFMAVLYSACKLVQFSFPVAWIFFIPSERLKRPAQTVRDLAAGALSGSAILILIWGVYLTAIRGSDLAAAASPRIASRIAAIGAASPARFLALTLFISVVHSFLEEYYWRWFVFGRLRIHWGNPLAVTLSSLAFAGHHVIVLHAFVGSGPHVWVTGLLSFGVALAGGLWAWLYVRSDSLLPAWLSHTLVDLGIMAIGYDMSCRLV